MRDLRPDPAGEKDHGAHTLKVWKGLVVGVYGDDVFVELGPRMQGVISTREFPTRPAIGDTHEYTLRGREDGLWALALRESADLSTWENMELGSLVHARAVRAGRDGLEMKIGPLHAFMPKSHTGLPRDQKPDVLVGKTLTCEVIEIDAERQRVLVSRKLVAQRERGDDRQRDVGALSVGQVVHGRVTRIEDYGVFVTFGRALEGMIHVSNLAYERVEHPSRVVQLGETLDVKVLALRNGGKRIALGLKQMKPSPWTTLRAHLPIGRIVEGTVKRVLPFGAFIAVLPGIEGLVHNTQADLRGQKDLGAQLQLGERISVRVVSLEEDQERLALSLLHTDGRPIHRDEALGHATFESLLSAAPTPDTNAKSPATAPSSSATLGSASGANLSSNLGQRLRAAIEAARADRGDGGPERT
jgi:small subunit ribosomal protein S1